MLRLTQRRDLQQSFRLRGGFRCKDVFSEIALLDNIFKVLTERRSLRSSASLVVVVGIVVSRFEESRVAGVCLWTFQPGLTFDGFEDVLNRELQRGETVRYLVSSGLTLLRMRERLLFESTLSASLEVNGGVSVSRVWFCSVFTAVERRVGETFHCLLQLDV